MKRHVKLIAVLLVVLTAMTVLFGCSDLLIGDTESIGTGDILDVDIIESIINAEAIDTTEKYPSETFDDGSLIVYWLNGGSVWHKSLNCSSLSNTDSDKLNVGSIREAFDAGKDRPCKNCSSDVDYTVLYETSDFESQTESSETKVRYTKDYDAQGDLIVYWSEGGSVWHESKYCPSIAKSNIDSYISGSPYDAYYSGKTRACKQCSADSNVVITDVTTEETQIFDIITEEPKYPKEYLPDGSIIVYWLDGGSVWHESRECKTVFGESSENLSSGTPEEAYYSGKNRPCKICSSDSTVIIDFVTAEFETSDIPLTADNKYSKEYYENGDLIVYWLGGGSVWHESRSCSIIMSSDPQKVIIGNVNEAYYSGKKRPCSICSSDSKIEIDSITTEDITETAEISTERYPKEYDSFGDLIVYWLGGGSVWHESKNCGTIEKAGSAAVRKGNVYDAYYAGKTRACMVCSSDSKAIIDIDLITAEAQTAETRSPETEDTATSDTVYWVENGGVWHTTRNCISLSRTDDEDVFSGSIDDASKCGKERACKRCS